MRVEIGKRTAVALIDTGATCSLIENELYEEIVSKWTRPSLLKPPMNLSTITGQPLTVIGRADIDLAGMMMEFVVIKDKIGPELLIGNDIMRRMQANIDYLGRRITLNGREYPMTDPAPGCRELVTAVIMENQVIDDLLNKYQELFHEEGRLLPQMTGAAPLTIETHGKPIAQRQYRAPLLRRFVIDQQVDSMLEQGIIRPSASPWASPVLLVPKKDGAPRFCIDYRRLNAVTKKDRHPLPQIQEIFDDLSGSSVFTTLDLKSGYWQLAVAPEDSEKTAFICHRGQFEFDRVPFGLANAPAVFQREMNRILSSVLGRCAMVYIDDVIIYSRNMSDHVRDLETVFQLMAERNVTLNRTKCTFARGTVELLGFEINETGIRPIASKVAAINDMSAPEDVKGVRSFLGMTNYYRQAIPGYAFIAEPFSKSDSKDHTF